MDHSWKVISTSWVNNIVREITKEECTITYKNKTCFLLSRPVPAFYVKLWGITKTSLFQLNKTCKNLEALQLYDSQFHNEIK